MGLASGLVDCRVRPWFIVQNGFDVRIPCFDWVVFTTRVTGKLGGIQRVTSGRELGYPVSGFWLLSLGV